MKRKIVSLLLVVVMGTSLLVGCGGNNDSGAGDGTNANVNQDAGKDDVAADDSSDNTEVDLKTQEILFFGEKIGTLTYNGNSNELNSADEYRSDFDMHIADGKGTYTVGAYVEAVTFADAETYYQDVKEQTETNEKVASSQFSEIKEAVLNEIPVKYFTRIYTMAAGNENKDFYCVVDFPVVDNKEYILVVSMHFGKEEELLLSGLENLLVDVEIQGVKSGAETEGTTVKNDEFYDPWYNEASLLTSGGKTVNVYFVGEGSFTCEADGNWIYIYDANDETYGFSVSDAASAEEYIDAFIQNNSHVELEIGTQEELQLCDRTIHSFYIKEKGSDEVWQSIGVIELASGVVFTFAHQHVNFGETGFEEVLGELRFKVE